MQIHSSSTVSSGYNGGVGRFVFLTLYPNDAIGKIEEKGSLEQRLNNRLEKIFHRCMFLTIKHFFGQN